MGYTHKNSLVDTIHESHTPCLRDLFSDTWQCLWHSEPFYAFRIDDFAKTINGWLPLNVFVGWLCPTCVTGTWVTSWIDLILIWYHYIVICTFVIIFNWELSIKDIKLRVLIKEVHIVFHWLTFRIIYLYIYSPNIIVWPLLTLLTNESDHIFWAAAN